MVCHTRATSTWSCACYPVPYYAFMLNSLGNVVFVVYTPPLCQWERGTKGGYIHHIATIAINLYASDILTTTLYYTYSLY